MSGMFRPRTSLISALSNGTPGLTTARSNGCAGRLVAASTARIFHCASWAACCSNACVRAPSTPSTSAPRACNSRHAATPLTPRPITRTFLSCKTTMFVWLVVRCQLRLLTPDNEQLTPSPNLQCAQRHHGAQNTKNVKPHHDLRLIPALLFKMMVQRRHEEH